MIPSGKISEAMVEAGARQLCRLDGYDPDGKKLFGPKVKTWEAYAKTAEAVLIEAISLPSPGTGGAKDGRILERIASAVTANRDGTSAQHDMANQIARECIPLFEQLGMTNEGDGWGFAD